jgi:hypothetical protein
MREALISPQRPGRLVRLAGLMFLVLTAAGCSSKYKPVPVSGVVTLDGKPLEGANVFFYAVGDAKEGRTAQGVTDKNGEFRLSTLGKDDGALRWDYKVVIHKYVPTLPNLKKPEFPHTPEGKAQEDDWRYKNFESKGIQPFKNALPAKYGDTNSTPLTCKVEGPIAGVPFELTSGK